MIRVGFFGTNDESLPALEALFSDDRFTIVFVVTDDDDLERTILRHTVDVHVVVSFGHIVSQKIIDAPRFGSVNVHPSLLPKWRGPTPVPAALLAGDTETGVSIIKMDAKMDHGPILRSYPVTLDGTERMPGVLLDLMRLGAKQLPGILVALFEHRLESKAQDHSKATFSKLFTRESGRLPRGASHMVIERMVRALQPWPGVWFEIDDAGKKKRVKILLAHIVAKEADDDLKAGDGQLRIGGLVLDEIQFEGKSPVQGEVFAKTHRGYRASIVQ